MVFFFFFLVLALSVNEIFLMIEFVVSFLRNSAVGIEFCGCFSVDGFDHCFFLSSTG